jgi:hypothetical protein
VRYWGYCIVFYSFGHLHILTATKTTNPVQIKSKKITITLRATKSVILRFSLAAISFSIPLTRLSCRIKLDNVAHVATFCDYGTT